ncbi:hypothetical protein [Muricoccus vinaceus]|uniref:Uncharacterized protein n=1 Tax=Muricoccus vinaceus TaxID=424704 RepID=A0ABV6IW69_9PROT
MTPMAVGEFASAGGARLAAEAYEAEEPPELRDELADAFLSGGEAEIQAASGQAFLLSLTDKAVTLSRIEGSALTEWARLDQPRTSGEGPEYMRPPRCEAPAELDLAIMLKIVTLASTQ